MAERFTKSAARNIFYGGTIFFFVVFVGLVAHSVSDANLVAEKHPITAEVAAGKQVWERHACFDCHTLYGEGARFAPELGKVWLKYGGGTSPKDASDGLKAWFAAQPTGAEGRHQMPQFHLSEADLDNLIAFLQWTSSVDTQNWPPHAPK